MWTAPTLRDPLYYRKVIFKLKTPQSLPIKVHMYRKVHPVLIQLSKEHSYWLRGYSWRHSSRFENNNHQTTLYTLSCLKKTEQSIRAGKTCIWPSTLQITEFKFHLRCCIFCLPYQWSSWTVYVQQQDWLKGFLLLGTNYDRAWFYDLSLQHHPPTLWARSEGSSVSIGDLHCTLRADLHHDRK